MSPVVVEHLVFVVNGDRVQLGREFVELAPGTNPISHAQQAYPGSLAHSTSWRWSDDNVVLTFAHVLPDGTPFPSDLAPTTLSAHDIEQVPVACHAIRHLHFLERTDAEIGSLEGLNEFWHFAAHVARHHHPAVAGLLPPLHAVPA